MNADSKTYTARKKYNTKIPSTTNSASQTVTVCNMFCCNPTHIQGNGMCISAVAPFGQLRLACRVSCRTHRYRASIFSYKDNIQFSSVRSDDGCIIAQRCFSVNTFFNIFLFSAFNTTLPLQKRPFPSFPTRQTDTIPRMCPTQTPDTYADDARPLCFNVVFRTLTFCGRKQDCTHSNCGSQVPPA